MSFTADQIRRGAAMQKIASFYVPRALRDQNPKDLKMWSERLADYATWMVASFLPPLTAEEAADVEPAESSSGPLTQAGIDAAFGKYTRAVAELGLPAGAGPSREQALEISTKLGIVREIAQEGAFGEPGETPGVDYSGYTRYVNDGIETRDYVGGELVHRHPGPATEADFALTVDTIK
jgi:hypothetical protein